jgi:excisionase family DNA binding protein
MELLLTFEMILTLHAILMCSAFQAYPPMSQKDFPPTVPSDVDRTNAKVALQHVDGLIFADQPWKVEVEDVDGQPRTLEIPPVVSAIFLKALFHTAAGEAISLLAIDSEVTTQQAARILKVSRPFVVLLVENGELPARQVGNRLRLPLADVLAYKAANGPKLRQTRPVALPTE